MYKSNYDKYPATPMEGIVWKGWENICNQLKSSLSAESCVLVIECYQGVLHDELRDGFAGLHADCWIDTQSLFKPVNEIEQMTYPYVTDDRLFGSVRIYHTKTFSIRTNWLQPGKRSGRLKA